MVILVILFFTQCYYWDASKLFCRNLSMQCLTLSWLKKNLRPADNFSCSQSYTLPDLNVCWELRKTREKSRVDIFDLLFCRQSGSSSCIRRSSIETVGHFILERHFGKKWGFVWSYRPWWWPWPSDIIRMRHLMLRKRPPSFRLR